MDAWRDFYELVGTAGASLVGLIFVAMSITAGYASESQHAAREAYATPTIVHLATVLVISLLALVPTTAGIAALATFGVEVAAFVYALVVVFRVWTVPGADLEDRICYGISPVLCYLCVATGSLGISLGWRSGAFILAAGGSRHPFDRDP